MRKKIVALLMALTMVPALAACGSSNGTGNNTTGNNTAGAPAESQTRETTAARGRLRQKPMQNLRQKHRLCPAP